MENNVDVIKEKLQNFENEKNKEEETSRMKSQMAKTISVATGINVFLVPECSGSLSLLMLVPQMLFHIDLKHKNMT